MSNYIQPLKQYITEELLQDQTVDIVDDQDLLLSGMLDSISVVRLASHIESTYAITVPPEDVIIENFGTLVKISSYIASRL